MLNKFNIKKMTYWLYDPKKLASSSTLIPYKQTNIGEFLNFLTISCMFIYIYLFKVNKIEEYGNILFFIFISIFLSGIILGLPKEENGEIFNFDNYQTSTFID